MADGAWTDHLELLLTDHLHNDQQLVDAYRANPGNALAPYELTAHEHHALVTRRTSDLLALGVVDSANDLPPVLRGTRRPGFGNSAIDRLRGLIGRAVDVLPGVPERLPRPPFPRPRPVEPPPGPPPPGPDLPGPRPDPPGP